MSFITLDCFLENILHGGKQRTSISGRRCCNESVRGEGTSNKKSIKSKILYQISLRDKFDFFVCGNFVCCSCCYSDVLCLLSVYKCQENVSDNIDTTVTAVSEVMDQSFLVMENLVLELAASNGVQNWLDDSHYYDRENSEFILEKQNLAES